MSHEAVSQEYVPQEEDVKEPTYIRTQEPAMMAVKPQQGLSLEDVHAADTVYLWNDKTGSYESRTLASIYHKNAQGVTSDSRGVRVLSLGLNIDSDTSSWPSDLENLGEPVAVKHTPVLEHKPFIQDYIEEPEHSTVYVVLVHPILCEFNRTLSYS